MVDRVLISAPDLSMMLKRYQGQQFPYRVAEYMSNILVHSLPISQWTVHHPVNTVNMGQGDAWPRFIMKSVKGQVNLAVEE